MPFRLSVCFSPFLSTSSHELAAGIIACSFMLFLFLRKYRSRSGLLFFPAVPGASTAASLLITVILSRYCAPPGLQPWSVTSRRTCAAACDQAASVFWSLAVHRYLPFLWPASALKSAFSFN